MTLFSAIWVTKSENISFVWSSAIALHEASVNNTVRFSNISSRKKTVLKYLAIISSDSLLSRINFNKLTVSNFTFGSSNVLMTMSLKSFYIRSLAITYAIKSVPKSYASSMNLLSYRTWVKRLRPASWVYACLNTLSRKLRPSCSIVGSVRRLCTTDAIYTLNLSQYESLGRTNFKTGSSDGYPKLYG